MIGWQGRGGELNTQTLTTNPLTPTAGLTTLWWCTYVSLIHCELINRTFLRSYKEAMYYNISNIILYSRDRSIFSCPYKSMWTAVRFKRALKMSAGEYAYLYWLRSFGLSPVWVFQCLFKALAWDSWIPRGCILYCHIGCTLGFHLQIVG